jgi:hypothetical protein
MQRFGHAGNLRNDVAFGSTLQARPVPAENSPVERDIAEVTPGVRRAALAFSALRRPEAESSSRLLTASDRARLRVGLAHIRDASLGEMRIALYELLKETRDGPLWVTPALHDAATCPFRCVERYDAPTVISADLVAARRPLHVAVALSHIDEELRVALFDAMPKETRTEVLRYLQDVPTVSLTRSRTIAKDLERLLSAR